MWPRSWGSPSLWHSSAAGATGNFAVAVAAFDRGGCLISTATSAIELGAADNDGFVYGRPERTLQLTLDAGPPTTRPAA